MKSGTVNEAAPGIENEKDSHLDVVAWRPFPDGKSSQLIAFGQCATGKNWKREKLYEMRPESFREKWMSTGWFPSPVRALFVPHTVTENDWHSVMVDGGLIFDRCRIAGLVTDLPDELRGRCAAWVTDVVGEMNAA